MAHADSTERGSFFQSFKNYFTTNELALYVFIVFIGTVFRWYALDMRPVHHDESQHGMFGRYFFDAPEFHYYRYNPMLHGPLLYNLYRLVYGCIGSDIWSFRVPMAFLGTIYMFVPFLFRRWFSPKALLFLTAGIALGPSLIYWSRFAREDFYVIFGLLSMVIGASSLFPRWGGSLVLFGLTIQLCSKANIFVHIPIIAAYMFFEVFLAFAQQLVAKKNYRDVAYHGALTVGSFAITIFLVSVLSLTWNEQTDVYAAYVTKTATKGALLLFSLGFFLVEAWVATSAVGEGTLLYSLRKNVATYWRENLTGLFVCSIIYCYLYSAGGRYPEGIVAGLGFEAISYWMEQHSIERISGPFLFQFYTLTWYEFPFILLYLAHVIHFYTRPGVRRYIGGYLLCQSFFLMIPFLYFDKPLQENAFSKFFGLKDLRDMFSISLLLIHPLVVTTTHLLENKKKLALWGYLFTSFFFSYSYLKERVPWLSMYPLILGLVYLTLYFDDCFQQKENRKPTTVGWSSVFSTTGAVLIMLGLLFICEGYFLIDPEIIKESTINENSGFLAFGVAFIILSLIEWKIRLFGQVRLATLLMTVLIVYNVRIAFLTNFVHPGHASEYISQVHTTPEFHDMAIKLRQKITAPLSGERPLVLGKGESTWPVTWYMAGVDNFNFDVPADKKFEDYDYAFDTWDDSEGLKKIPEGYVGRQLEFRGWWVPDFNVISFKRFLRYTINHTPWSPTGFTYLLYMSKKGKD